MSSDINSSSSDSFLSSWREKIDDEMFVESIIRLLIEFLAMGGLYFLLIGRNTNYDNTSLFLYCTTLLTVSLIPFESISALLFKLKKKSSEMPDGSPVLVWLRSRQSLALRYQSWFSLAVVVLGMLVMVAVNQLLYNWPLWLILIVALILNFIMVYGVAWLSFNLFFKQIDLDNLPSQKQDDSALTEDSLIAELLSGWLLGLVAVAILTSVKTIDEATFALGEHKLSEYAFSIATTGYFVCLWAFYGAQEHVGNAVAFQADPVVIQNKITFYDMLFLAHIMAAAVFLFLSFLGWLFDPGYWFSVFLSVSLVVASGCAGLISGVIWKISQSEEQDNSH